MPNFIEHPYVGQIVIFNPANLDKDDFNFYNNGHYFDYTYFVDSAVASSIREGRIILQTHLHKKIEGRKGHHGLDESLLRKRKINLGAEKMLPISQNNRSYVVLLEKES